jgi:hypothetical protein
MISVRTVGIRGNEDGEKILSRAENKNKDEKYFRW